jgi:hypothetical protein
MGLDLKSVVQLGVTDKLVLLSVRAAALDRIPEAELIFHTEAGPPELGQQERWTWLWENERATYGHEMSISIWNASDQESDRLRNIE